MVAEIDLEKIVSEDIETLEEAEGLADEFLFTLVSCARCGDPHEDLEFKLLENSTLVRGVLMSHWAMCPVKEQPVIFCVVDLGWEK